MTITTYIVDTWCSQTIDFSSLQGCSCLLVYAWLVQHVYLDVPFGTCLPVIRKWPHARQRPLLMQSMHGHFAPPAHKQRATLHRLESFELPEAMVAKEPEKAGVSPATASTDLHPI